MDTTNITVTGELGHARAVLAALIETWPTTGESALEVVAVIEALAILDQRTPPLPPPALLPAGHAPPTMATAMHALTAAAATADDPGEAARIADAGAALATPVTW